MTDVPAVRAALPVHIVPTVTVPTPGTAAAPAPNSGSAIPAALALLGVGTVLTGVVAERGARNQIVIRTDKGSISLQTPLALRIGTAVTLQIQSIGAQSQAMILSVNGQPLASQSAALVTNVGGHADKTPTTPATESAAGKAPLFDDSSGKMPAGQAMATQPPSASLRPGAVTTGTLTPITPTPAALHSIAQQVQHAVGGQNFAAEPVSIRVLGVSMASPRAVSAGHPPEVPPPRVAPGIAIAADAVTFSATVVGDSSADSSNTTLLRTPLGLMRLPLPAGVAPDSQMLLELLTPRGNPAADTDRMAQDLGASRRLVSAGQEWPALRDIIGALKTAAPDIANKSMAASVPQVGPSLAAGLLLFIAAARNGNPRHWLGEQAVETLERVGQGALINRLSDDMANLPRLAETQANGWQTLLLPVFDGDKLRQIRMSMRRSRKDENGGMKEGARFIIEAELSKLGPLQLDGLVRLPNFDLAVRTQDNLPPEIRANIVEIFNDAMQATRLTGTVAFQVARESRPGPFENWQAIGPGITV
jgi:hypothetical protein